MRANQGRDQVLLGGLPAIAIGGDGLVEQDPTVLARADGRRGPVLHVIMAHAPGQIVLVIGFPGPGL